MASVTENIAASWFETAWNGLMSADPGWVGAWIAFVGLPIAAVGVWIAWKAYRKPEKAVVGRQRQSAIVRGKGNQVTQTIDDPNNRKSAHIIATKNEEDC